MKCQKIKKNVHPHLLKVSIIQSSHFAEPPVQDNEFTIEAGTSEILVFDFMTLMINFLFFK